MNAQRYISVISFSKTRLMTTGGRPCDKKNDFNGENMFINLLIAGNKED